MIIFMYAFYGFLNSTLLEYLKQNCIEDVIEEMVYRIMTQGVEVILTLAFAGERIDSDADSG